MLSACAGAILTSLLVTPFDVVKTRMQAGVPNVYEETFRQCCREVFFSFREGASPHKMGPCSSPTEGTAARAGAALECGVCGTPAPTTRPVFPRITGTWDGVTKILRYEGFAALWRGLSPTLVMQIPSTVVYYTGYEYTRDTISARLPTNHQQYSPLLAGALSRTIAATLISPVELVRTRMQSGHLGKSVGGVLGGVLSMVRTQGWRILWRGLTPTLWRDVPFSAIYWVGYESIKGRLASRYPLPRSSADDFWISFAAGATSGMFAAVVTTPFDVAKTLQQVAQKGNASVHVNTTMAQTMRDIITTDGWRGLFRGLSPRVAKVAPACAIMISSYEVGKRFFENSNARHNQSAT
ncbi:mitochondrial carrier domain-containing protein [Gaertneriomyces semiglobifer]|nr:mitochondrial carrier domain-containing protein [Gaertneriomyces semiglobifer]